MSISAAQSDLVATAYKRHHGALLTFIEAQMPDSGWHDVEDVASEVWLRLAKRAAKAGDGLPGEGDIEEVLAELGALVVSERDTLSMREIPSRTVVSEVSPLAGVPRRSVPVERFDYAHGVYYTADLIDGDGVVVTRRGHWYATYDAPAANNDRVCRGCGVKGHFEHVLDSRGGPKGCPAPAHADDIRKTLWVLPETPIEMPHIQSPALTVA